MYVHDLTCEKYQQTKCKYRLQCMYTTKDKYDLMLSTVIGNSAQSACAAGGKFSWWLATQLNGRPYCQRPGRWLRCSG